MTILRLCKGLYPINMVSQESLMGYSFKILASLREEMNLAWMSEVRGLGIDPPKDAGG